MFYIYTKKKQYHVKLAIALIRIHFYAVCLIVPFTTD